MKTRPAQATDTFDQVKLEAEKHELPAALVGMDIGDLLLPYQQQGLQEASIWPLLAIDKSRRIGFTWALAALGALTAGASKAAGGMKVWYMGYDMEMAREFIDTVGMWAKAFNLVASEVGEYLVEDEHGDIKAFRVTFASGFEVVALPSVARALRGKQGLVILDEAAFMSDLEEVLKAALALMIWGGRVIVVSTHDGTDNPFNILIDDIKAGKRKGGHIQIDFQRAIADGLYERVALVSKNPDLLPKAEWIKNIYDTYGDNAAEELDCIPKSGGGSWINPGDYTACEHDEAGKPELYQGGPVVIGRDVSRRGDISVIWAFEIIGETLWLRERWEEVGATFAAQDEAMDDMIRRYRTVKVMIDQTGMGEKVVEDAQLRWGELVEGVIFSAPRRLDLATSYRTRFETCTIRIAKDPKIRADHRSLKRASRKNKVLAEGEVHPDMFWAGALADAAASGGFSEYDYEAAARSASNDEDEQDGFGNRLGSDMDGGSTRHGMARGGVY